MEIETFIFKNIEFFIHLAQSYLSDLTYDYIIFTQQKFELHQFIFYKFNKTLAQTLEMINLIGKFCVNQLTIIPKRDAIL